MAPTSIHRFDFSFEDAYRLPARLFGVHPGSAWVELDDETFHARFGPWQVTTPLSNITGVQVSGPYSRPRTIGPAHLSFSDRGLTFATTSRLGVCISFREPVRGMDPLGVLRHPGLTVTVADTDGLLAALDDAADLGAHADEAVQAAEDHLHVMTASQLRALARERGIAHASSAKKADLVDLLEAELAGNLVGEAGRADDPGR